MVRVRIRMQWHILSHISTMMGSTNESSIVKPCLNYIGSKYEH